MIKQAQMENELLRQRIKELEAANQKAKANQTRLEKAFQYSSALKEQKGQIRELVAQKTFDKMVKKATMKGQQDAIQLFEDITAPYFQEFYDWLFDVYYDLYGNSILPLSRWAGVHTADMLNFKFNIPQYQAVDYNGNDLFFNGEPAAMLSSNHVFEYCMLVLDGTVPIADPYDRDVAKVVALCIIIVAGLLHDYGPDETSVIGLKGWPEENVSIDLIERRVLTQYFPGLISMREINLGKIVQDIDLLIGERQNKFKTELEESIKKSRAIIEDLLKKEKALNEQVRSLQYERTKSEWRNENKEREIEELNKQLRETNKQIEKLNENLKSQEELEKEMREEFEKKRKEDRKENEEQKIVIKELKKDIEGKKKSIEEFEKIIRDRDRLIRELRKPTEKEFNLERRLKDTERQLKKEREEREKIIDEQVKDREERVKKQKEELEDMEQELKDKKRENKKKIRRLKREAKKEIDKQREESEAQIKKKQEELEEKEKKQKEEFEEEKEKMLKQNAELSRKVRE